MTFRQVLEALWRRRLLIGATTALVLLFALLYLSQQTRTYTSSSTVRLSPAATSSSDSSGAYSGINLDTDTDTVTSPTVLGPAAKRLGGTSAADVGVVGASLIEGIRTNRIVISATGSDPQLAQRRADAVANAYVAYLEGQVKSAVDNLKQDQQEQSKALTEYSKALAGDPKNPVLQTNIASAQADLSATNGNLSSLTNAGPPATILQAATPGDLDSASPKVVVAIAILAGLIAGVGAALVREQFDDRVLTEAEVEQLTETPALGSLAIDRRRRGRDEVVLPAAERVPTAFNESVRALRTSLQVLLPGEHAVVVLTSPEPGDGKTFVTANLAVSWARAGKSVILVGGDLRRPRLGVYFGEAANGKGLADLALQATKSDAVVRADVEALLRPTDYEGLRVLPAGLTARDPADLLARDGLEHVINHLRAIADVVVIDSPPALGMTDAALLGAASDGVAILASAGRSKSGTLLQAVKSLRASNLVLLGSVLNRSRRKLPKSYRAYYQDEAPSTNPAGAATRRTHQVDPQTAARALTLATPAPKSSTPVWPGLEKPDAGADREPAAGANGPSTSDGDEPLQSSGDRNGATLPGKTSEAPRGRHAATDRPSWGRQRQRTR